MSIIKKTCIVCPIGCHLEAEVSDSGEILSVSGNTCKRGETYIRDEVTNPRRTLTSNRLEFGEVSGHRVLIKRGPGNRGPTECGTTHEATSGMSS